MIFDRRHRNLTSCRPSISDLTNLGNVIARWLPFAGRRSTVGSALQHLGTLPLTTQSSLVLVRVYRETLVLGITPQSVTLLTKAAADSSTGVPGISEAIAKEPENRGSCPTVSRREEDS